MSVEFEELAKLRENAGDEGQSKNSLTISSYLDSAIKYSNIHF